jgi:hypothetical protein
VNQGQGDDHEQRAWRRGRSVQGSDWGARRLVGCVVTACYRQTPRFITFSAFDPAEHDAGSAEP